MKPQTIVTAALLLFVAAGVAAMAWRQLNPDSASGQTEKDSTDETAGEAPLADGVIAYYLHGDERCVTCKAIQTCAKKAVDAELAEAEHNGGLQWLVRNYDRSEHKHFKSDYQVEIPMVVLVRRANGKDVESVNLVEVWPLVTQGDREGCVEYVHDELRAFLESSAT